MGGDGAITGRHLAGERTANESSGGKAAHIAYGLLTHCGSNNLGDEIQSLAAARFLPRVDRLIPREDLRVDPRTDGQVRIILNGWFMHHPRRWPPHDKVVPLITSIHLAPYRPRRWAWLPSPARILLAPWNAGYLRRHEPIGARDRATLALLQRHGVDSYYSGCLTLTLPAAEGHGRHGVVACDLPPELLETLAKRTRTPPRVTTHVDTVTADPGDRLRKAEELLRLYAGAKAVVTTRLHCALPCLAMGTPVLFIPIGGGREHPRLEPALELANCCTQRDFLAGRDGFDPEDPPSNPTAFRTLADRLARRCETFVAAGLR